MTDLLAPDYAHSALLIIDFQNDAVLPGAPMEIAGSYDVLPQLAALVRVMRHASRPIVHVVRGYLPDGSNVDLCRRSAVQNGARFLTPKSAGADFPDALKPADAPPLDWDALLAGEIQRLGPKDWVLYKSRWGAFYQTALEDFLRAHDINTLIVGGCNFPNCPRTSIYEASERDFRLVLAQDAISGLYEQGKEELSAIGVCITTTAAIAQELESL